MDDRNDARRDREDRKKAQRRRIVERLNSHQGGFSGEALKDAAERERRRRREIELELERGKRHPGF